MAPPSRPSSTQKRILQEVNSTAKAVADHPSILRLSPVSDTDLYNWTCVLSGASLPTSTGYTSGRWLISLTLSPPSSPAPYPLSPPTIKFLTPICAANIDFDTGEVCLDLLKGAWSPAYTLVKTIEAIVQMLVEPGVDSPLGVEVAKLERDGDDIGREGLVRFWCGEKRYEGD